MNLKSLLSHKRYSPVFIIFLTSIILSFATRLILLISFGKDIHVGFLPVFSSFFVGLLYDIVVGLFISIPFVLQISFTNNFIYSKTGKWFGILFFIAILYVLYFTSIIPKEFNKDLHKFLGYYIILRFVIYLFLLFATPTFREKWRSAVLQMATLFIMFLLIFNAISEWFFWDEFSSRYNFIAVDYLVYTNEVLGNIKESYPITWIVIGVLVLSLAIFWIFKKYIQQSVRIGVFIGKRLMFLVIFIAIPILSILIVKSNWKDFSENNYSNELAGNGIYEFVQAFKNNELDFYKYYETIPDEEAFKIVRNQLSDSNSTFVQNDGFSIERDIHYAGTELRKNVVLISVESLSASFLKAFGNEKNITPQLDSLANAGMLFTNLYASGTRTVRGLEALALSIPPTPGQSLVKRPNNENLFSLGSVFKKKGYNTQYIYGGYGYFDNMNYFFGHNNYEVIDRDALSPKEIHYANIWGVADEDLFTLALKNMDKNAASGKPFFTQVMTVSNHRPYTYPENRIDIPPTAKSRNGAVKYTDYAIGDFIKRASTKAWFNNTIFVIVADHCASSAGSTALPVKGYHIPMIIYSPGFIHPQKVEALTAQIDIGPTILGMLNMNYRSKFFGLDIFNSSAGKNRAFISTYQGLGYLTNNQLVVQSPVKTIHTYLPDFKTGENKETKINDSIVHQAIANYQVAAWLIRNKKYGAE